MEGAQLKRSNLVRDMGKLLESRELSDVTLRVGDRQIPAHRAVLAARSPVFAEMLRRDEREGDSSSVDIPDVEEEVVLELLRYMYTDRVAEGTRLTEKLLIVADKYDLPLLKRRCEEKMIRKIRVENAAALAVFAATYSCTRLRSYVVGFVRAHKEDVFASDGWVEAQKSSPKAIEEICSMLAAAESGKRTAAEMAGLEDLELSLEYEAQYGPLEEVRALVARGADLEARSRKDRRRTALHAAAAKGRREIVEFLVREGADVDSKDADGLTALNIAAERGDLEIVKALLRAGADGDTRARDGTTPLHLAASNGHVDVARALVANSADVNLGDRNGYTPLHCAAHWDQAEVARLLLEAGADRDAKNFKRKTPLEVVKQKNREKWEEILRDRGRTEGDSAELGPAEREAETEAPDTQHEESDDRKKTESPQQPAEEKEVVVEESGAAQSPHKE